MSPNHTSANGLGNGTALRARPADAAEALASIVGAVDGEVVFCTCIDSEGYVFDSECFASRERSKTTIPMDALWHLPKRLGAAAVMFTSKSSGSLEDLEDSDLDFTKRLIEAGLARGIPVLEHVLEDGEEFRLLRETTRLWA